MQLWYRCVILEYILLIYLNLSVHYVSYTICLVAGLLEIIRLPHWFSASISVTPGNIHKEHIVSLRMIFCLVLLYSCKVLKWILLIRISSKFSLTRIWMNRIYRTFFPQLSLFIIYATVIAPTGENENSFRLKAVAAAMCIIFSLENRLQITLKGFNVSVMLVFWQREE